MALEIEHKYLVKNDSYKALASSFSYISQGYLCREPERTVRVRIRDDKGYLTIKGKNIGSIREEYEYQIPYEEAKRMMSLCVPPVIEKMRYIVPFGDHIWEIDEFAGDRSGLVTAEVELSSSNEEYLIPDFIGEDVTGNPAYYNSNLK